MGELDFNSYTGGAAMNSYTNKETLFKDEQNTKQNRINKIVNIDFLYLDLSTCTRCIGTKENLEIAIDSVKQISEFTGVQLNINKVLIESEEKARTHRFITSPTIRVNGRDIALETIENRCDSCTDLCGCEEGTKCRIWVYQGKEYTEAPVAMIVDALLQEVYGMPQKPADALVEYGEVPENLQNFFTNLSKKTANTSSACCTSEKQENCYEPSKKSACCGAVSQTGSCGC